MDLLKIAKETEHNFLDFEKSYQESKTYYASHVVNSQRLLMKAKKDPDGELEKANEALKKTGRAYSSSDEWCAHVKKMLDDAVGAEAKNHKA